MEIIYVYLIHCCVLHGLYKMEVVEYLMSNGNTEPTREKIYKKRTIKARNRILNTSTALKWVGNIDSYLLRNPLLLALT